jgi:hypothetical protein
MTSPHSLGVHKVLKHLTPLVKPLVEFFPKHRLENAVNTADLRLCAEQRTHPMCFGYLDSGGDDEVPLRRNKDAYSEYEMHFKVLGGLKPPLDMSKQIGWGLKQSKQIGWGLKQSKQIGWGLTQSKQIRDCCSLSSQQLGQVIRFSAPEAPPSTKHSSPRPEPSIPLPAPSTPLSTGASFRSRCWIFFWVCRSPATPDSIFGTFGLCSPSPSPWSPGLVGRSRSCCGSRCRRSQDSSWVAGAKGQQLQNNQQSAK